MGPEADIFRTIRRGLAGFSDAPSNARFETNLRKNLAVNQWLSSNESGGGTETPSPLARRGHGLTALAFDRKMKSADRKQVRRLFARAGEVIEIPEVETLTHLP